MGGGWLLPTLNLLDMGGGPPVDAGVSPAFQRYPPSFTGLFQFLARARHPAPQNAQPPDPAPAIHQARKNYCPTDPSAPARTRLALAFIAEVLNSLIRQSILTQTGQSSFSLTPTEAAVLESLGFDPVPETRSVLAGLGLSGGGTLDEDVTFFLPDTITPGTYAPQTITINRHGQIVGMTGQAVGGYPAWAKVTKTYADFSDPSTSKTIPLFTLPPKAIVLDAFAKHSVAFAGGALSSVALNVGFSGSPSDYINTFDVFLAVADSAYANNNAIGFPYYHSGKEITATVISVGDNLDAATQGSVEIAVLYAIVP